MSLTQINKAGLDEIALDHVFTIGATDSSAYRFQGEGLNGIVNNPTLYLTRGKTYRFENGSGAHPFRIQSTTGTSGTAYNTGVTNNNAVGTVIMEVQHDAPDVLYYQCTSHAAMNGILYITGALADGGVTTAKIADDAVTNAKIAAGAVGGTELAGNIAANKLEVNDAHIIIGDNSNDGALQTLSGDVTMTRTGAVTIANDAVTTAKIADSAVTGAQIASGAVSLNKLASDSVGTAKIIDQAVTLAKLPHGTSSNDGKFLRANNGADPTFETVTGTTINNNANNRIITGSGTANTLNGESALTFDNSTDTLQVHQTDAGNNPAFKSIHRGGSGTDINAQFTNYSGTTSTNILHNGHIGIGTTTAANKLEIASSAHYVVSNSGQARNGIHIRGNGGNAGEYGGAISFGCNNTGAAAIAARQATSDTDVIGLSFFTHDSSTGSADAVEKVRIHDGGTTSFNNGICLGNGVTYSAANVMDDYEEGSFNTIQVRGNGSVQMGYTYRQANYIKIGKYVFMAFDVRGTRNNMSGDVYMTLPFTSMTNGGTAGGGACNAWALGTSNHYGVHVQIDNNTSLAYFTYQWSNNNTSTLSGSMLYNSTNLRGQLAYIAAS